MNINNNKFNLSGKEILKKFKEIYRNVKFKTNTLSRTYKSILLKRFK